ncbi:MAG: organic solvent resistance ABC transporter ATP-binding protein [Acidobacteria bacterium]|nr:MAG: organic solvent resistance ABC transporter ATP-binding protein [Acidobacteriota bacterium]
MSTASQSGTEKAIVFENVSLRFDEQVVLDGLSFELDHGATKVLLGVAGAGKTTILKLTLGLVRPDNGRIFVLGQEVTAMRETELFELRRRLGIVFQESALFDSQTVEENVAFRLLEERVPEHEIERRVLEALRFVELEQTLNLLPAELSGGMRRRVAIARAIISNPEILLYDSPTAGLDPVTSTTIMELLMKQRDVYHTSALLVTHRLQDAFMMATHVFSREQNKMVPVPPGTDWDSKMNFMVLKDGKIFFEGSAAEIANSDDQYIREYLTL